MKNLDELDTITQILQGSYVTIRDSRDIFDAVLMKEPDRKRRVSASVKNMKIKTFENTIAKTQTSRKSELTKGEVSELRALKLESSAESTVTKRTTKIDLFAQLVHNRMKTDDKKVGSSYRDLEFIVPTSNKCQRYFSKAGDTSTTVDRQWKHFTWDAKFIFTLTVSSRASVMYKKPSYMTT